MKSDKEKYVIDKEGITCPSCLQLKRTKEEVSKFIEQLNSLTINPTVCGENRNYYFESAKKYKSEIDYLEIKWACNECLGKGKAIISKTINEQRDNIIKSPVFAFFDLKKECVKCRSSFIFRKDEWQYWIDELNFFYQTTKKYCENCQPEALLKKKLSKKILKQRTLGFCEEYVDLALEVSEIYKQLGMTEKSKGYLKTIINQFKSDDNPELRGKIKMAYDCLKFGNR